MAQTPRFLGSFESWSAWTFRDGNVKACYIYAEAATKTPEHLDHGRVGLFVRRLKSGETRTEASFQTGYQFAPDAITVSVDRERFRMIPRGGNAWLRRSSREEEFVHAVAKGRMLIVEAVSKRGNRTHYTFSLKGVSAAMRKVRRECP
jgi:hypothetical protein